jgi:hypothetical protein
MFRAVAEHHAHRLHIREAVQARVSEIGLAGIRFDVSLEWNPN